MSQSPQANRSDLLIILQNLDALLHQMRSSVNAVSGQLLTMAAAVECVTLTMKLRATLDRWQVYLPFHEFRDVDFSHWVQYLTAIHHSLDSRQSIQTGAYDYEYYPDYPFCLDLLDALKPGARPMAEQAADDRDGQGSLPLFAPRYAGSELETDVMEYVLRVDEQMGYLGSFSDDEELEWHTRIDKRAMSMLRKQYADHLRLLFRKSPPNLVEQEILPKSRAYLNAIIGQPAMAYCLDMALDTLLDVMRQIDNLFSTDKSSQQYLRLSLRLYYRHCPDARQKAISRVHRWASEWPERKRQLWAMEKRDQIAAALRQRYGTLRISDYIDIERPCPLTEFEFGHFLFASRHQLETDSVRILFQDCFLIQQLNHLIDPAGAAADIEAGQLSPHRKQTYQRLVELIRLAEWQGGMTSEQVQHCLADLLLKPETPSDISETFWILLTARRNCGDDFRSLKLTWLNLVGYFRSRGFLKGGSPALCRHFFPDGTPEGKGNNADYNAVSKGARNDVGNDFHDLVLVLDKQL